MADEKTVDGGTDQSGKDEPSNVEERLARLEKESADYKKALEDERKASAGKDKKISEQGNVINELRKTTLSKDELLQLREKELLEREAKAEAKMAAELQELEMLRLKMMKQEKLTALSFPSELWEFVDGTTPEEIETRARKLANFVTKQGNLKDNARKVTGKPKSGNGRQVDITADEINRMSPDEKTRWAANATTEELEAVLDDLE